MCSQQPQNKAFNNFQAMKCISALGYWTMSLKTRRESQSDVQHTLLIGKDETTKTTIPCLLHMGYHLSPCAGRYHCILGMEGLMSMPLACTVFLV